VGRKTKILISSLFTLILLPITSIIDATAVNAWLLKGKVTFEGKTIPGAEISYLNQSGGFTGVSAISNSDGSFELQFSEPGTGTISILAPSIGKPKYALGNFLVTITNQGIKEVRYDSPPSTEYIFQIEGIFQFELKKPTLILRVLNNGNPVESPTLEPNGWGWWSYLRGNKDGYIALYVKSCKEKCRNYGFFYLGYLEGPFNVVKTSNGFAARVDYQGIAEVKDQFGQAIQSIDGVFNLNLLTSKQMPNGSLNLGIAPPGIDPVIKNFSVSASSLLHLDKFKISFQVESSSSLENLDRPSFVKVALRDKAKTRGIDIPVTREGKDPFISKWIGEVTIPIDFKDGEYEVSVFYNAFGPKEETYKESIIIKSKISTPAPSNTPSSSSINLEKKENSTVTKRKTIICVKGKITKKLIALNPICPKGYTRK